MDVDDVRWAGCYGGGWVGSMPSSSGAGKPGRCVARLGVPGQVGERLYCRHDLVVQVQVVAGRPGQLTGPAPPRPAAATRRAARSTDAGRPASAAGIGGRRPTSRSQCPERCTAAPPTRTPAARPRRRPAPRRAAPPTRTGTRRASDGPPAADRTGPSQRVTPAVPSDRGSMRPRPESCQLPARMPS